MAPWNPASVKAQLRVTAQRLAQLQEKKDSQGQIMRRDIATLLQQGSVELARAKAQHLLEQDILGDVLEILEMHVGLILEHFNDLDQSLSPSPVVVEAASSIIFATPHVECRDLSIVRDTLVQRLGPDFARSAINNQEGHVARQIIRALFAAPPTAIQLDRLLVNIANTYSVKWIPEVARQDIVNDISELLDTEVSSTMNLPQLHKLCAQGLPDDPPWLRPRVWKLFFGILPAMKSSWKGEMQNQRESYYNLVRRRIGSLSFLPPPASPLDPHDAALLDLSRQLNGVAPSLLSHLKDEPENAQLCPLDDRAQDGIRIDCAANVESRLQAIRDQGLRSASDDVPSGVTPEIRVESEDTPTPGISVSPLDPPRHSTTVLHSRSYHRTAAHPIHLVALHRLLYLHSCINPALHSPYLPSLLVPLYIVLLSEADSQELAHAEADTFWLFEAMIGEFSDLFEDDSCNLWMRRFSEQVSSADDELFTDLIVKGLDPALPHYSHRWFSSLLTQMMPLASVFVVWDVMFSLPMRDRENNPKLDYLLDFCTASLIRIKPALFRLGQPRRGLWIGGHEDLPPPQLSTLDIGDAFLEGVTLLQHYPIQSAGGIDRLIQTTSDLSHRRRTGSAPQRATHLGFGARLKATVWKGLVRIPSPDSPIDGEDDDEESTSDEPLPDDGNDTETPQALVPSGITSRLAHTVWKGITNQTAMEPSTSPLPALSPSASPSVTPSTSADDLDDSSPRSSISSAGSTSASSLWSYAEKLKDSDTVASLAKVSTNWRAKAMLGSWSAGAGLTFLRDRSTVQDLETESVPTTGGGLSSARSLPSSDGARVSSLPDTIQTDIYTPPERPAFFRPPRDSMLPQPRRSPLSGYSSPDTSPRSEPSLLSKAHHIPASLASLSRPSNLPSESKAVPRPLLLTSGSLFTSTTHGRSSPTPLAVSQSAPIIRQNQWDAVLRAKAQSLHKPSQSTASSISASDSWARSPRSDRESDSGLPSRIVPLNRKSVSPMAAGIRTPSRRPSSPASSATSSERGFTSPKAGQRALAGDAWNSSGLNGVQVDHEQPKKVPLTELPTPAVRRTPRRKAVPKLESEADDTSDSSLVHAPTRNVRSRLYRRNPPNLSLPTWDNSHPEQVISPNSALAPENVDHDLATTPKASYFDYSPTGSKSPLRSRKYSAEDKDSRSTKNASEAWTRKTGTEPLRMRKISGETKVRDSAAIEGDDEGYDDLLSAYESEENIRPTAL